jgi:hypothetical protein
MKEVPLSCRVRYCSPEHHSVHWPPDHAGLVLWELGLSKGKNAVQCHKGNADLIFRL